MHKIIIITTVWIVVAKYQTAPMAKMSCKNFDFIRETRPNSGCAGTSERSHWPLGGYRRDGLSHAPQRRDAILPPNHQIATTQYIKGNHQNATLRLQRTWLNCLPITASASRRGGLRSATTSNLQGSYHVADCQPTAPVPLVSLVQSAGTLYRTIWSHLAFLLIVLGSS